MAMNNVTSPPQEAPKISMTTKEWVVPPRPKPGRKPATDTPPSKRKAQNRAAQRAFRERRAARVNELEEQIEEQREEYERIEQELRKRARGLEAELQTFKAKCVMLEGMLERERVDRIRLQGDIEAMRQKWKYGETALSVSSAMHMTAGSLSAITAGTPSGYGVSPAESVFTGAQPSQHPTRGSSTKPDPPTNSQSFSIAQILSAPGPVCVPAGCSSCGQAGKCTCAEDILADADIADGCGKCTLGSRCECLEETLASSGMPTTAELKRPYSPGGPSVESPGEKRPRKEADAGSGLLASSSFYSKDTTTIPPFTSQPTSSSLLPPSSMQAAIGPRDSCGFCNDGMYCLCAEAAATQNPAPVAPSPPETVPDPKPLSIPQTRTPPPESDAAPSPVEVTSTGAIKLPSFSGHNRRKAAGTLSPKLASAEPSLTSGCGPNGPGTCAQCLSDPRSGLFCRSLAASFGCQGFAPSSSGGCCRGGSSASTGCCKSNAPSKIGLSLSCADAYKTLRTHKNFEAASDDIGSWIPHLRAQPSGKERKGNGGGEGGRDLLPIEVEAASIMSVLKEFDVRFGKGQ